MKKIILAILLASTTFSSWLAADEIILEKYHRYSGNSTREFYDLHYSALGYINKLISSMTNQLVNNKDFNDIKNPAIAVTSFVNRRNFEVTSELSDLLSENLIHEIQVRGFKVMDFKLMEGIKVSKDGDFIFTRDVDKLRKKINVDYVLTGTYSSYEKGTLINARIVDLKTQLILSTAQIMIPSYVSNHLKVYPKKIADFYPNMMELSK